MHKHQLTPGEPFQLSNLPTAGRQFYEAGKEAAVAAFKAVRAELRELQRCFYADNGHKLLVIFQAMDAGGKDGTILLWPLTLERLLAHNCAWLEHYLQSRPAERAEPD